MRTVSDGKMRIRRFFKLNMCASNEFEEPSLDLVPFSLYLSVEPTHVRFVHQKPFIACDLYQAAKPYCPNIEIRTTCLTQNSFRSRLHNDSL